MANNVKELDRVLELILDHKDENGISYSGIHEAYFSKFKIRLGDQILKPIITQLLDDSYVSVQSVPGEPEKFYNCTAIVPGFIHAGAYQGKATRENELLQRDLKIKELELELEVSKNQIYDLENRKTYKGLFITIIVLLLVVLGATINYCHKALNKTNETVGDSIATENVRPDVQPANGEETFKDYQSTSESKSDSSSYNRQDTVNH